MEYHGGEGYFAIARKNLIERRWFGSLSISLTRPMNQVEMRFQNHLSQSSSRFPSGTAIESDGDGPRNEATGPAVKCDTEAEGERTTRVPLDEKDT